MAEYGTTQVRKWRYSVNQMKVLIGGKTVNIPVERFSSMQITNKYLENLYPLIKITITISSDTYYSIQQNKDKCKFYIRIDKFNTKVTDDGTYNENDASNKKAWLNDTFDLILDDNTEDATNSMRLEESANDYTVKKNDNSDKLEFVDNEVTFYLFKTLKQLKTNVNKVFQNVNVTDAIAYLISESGLTNVIMQQPDNTTMYDTLLIPPSSISKALYHIDTYYGIYKTGTIFFSDIDYTYILPMSSAITARTSKQSAETHIIIPKSTTDHNYQTGSLLTSSSSNTDYIVADATRLNISNDSISNDYINGSDSETIDSYSGYITTTNANTTTMSTAVVKYNDNGTENEFYSSMQSAIANSLQSVIQFNLKDFDISAIRLNKKYTVLFEDTTYANKYKGNYLISNAIFNLVKEGESATLDATVELRKMSY